MKGWGERRGAGGNHRRGNGEGGKGRFWGAGDRQSHRGSALSLTGWGSYPRPQRKGTPSDSTICRPSNHPSLHLQAPGSPHPPFSPAHTAAPAPPPRLLHAPLHACSPLSPSWATILHKCALWLSCALRLGFLRLPLLPAHAPLPWHTTASVSPRSTAPWSQTLPTGALPSPTPFS